jgi:hypothetical protein
MAEEGNGRPQPIRLLVDVNERQKVKIDKLEKGINNARILILRLLDEKKLSHAEKNVCLHTIEEYLAILIDDKDEIPF